VESLGVVVTGIKSKNRWRAVEDVAPSRQARREESQMQRHGPGASSQDHQWVQTEQWWEPQRDDKRKQRSWQEASDDS